MEEHSFKKIYSTSRNSQTSCPGPSSSLSAPCLGKVFLGILLWVTQPRRLGGVGVEGASFLPQLQSRALFSLCRGQAAPCLSIPSPAHIAETLFRACVAERTEVPCSPPVPPRVKTTPDVAVWEYWGQEGNGNPLQLSCLENPTDRGAWRATVHGVAKSD